MPEDCALSLDNVTVVPRGYFTERITRLGADRLTLVCSALAVATGCP
jgi:mRNA-degrading endonuclease toxin of MazEF toxin-antitoxin module